jgi:hypothetical protein
LRIPLREKSLRLRYKVDVRGSRMCSCEFRQTRAAQVCGGARGAVASNSLGVTFWTDSRTRSWTAHCCRASPHRMLLSYCGRG